jgi:hypothetical protein
MQREDGDALMMIVCLFRGCGDWIVGYIRTRGCKDAKHFVLILVLDCRHGPFLGVNNMASQKTQGDTQTSYTDKSIDGREHHGGSIGRAYVSTRSSKKVFACQF